MIWVSAMKVNVTMKYKKKVRLLVTNFCSKGCSYCHNEGMQKDRAKHLDPASLERYLPDFKKYTNRIVLSGGEPFAYRYLSEMVDMLTGYGFDLTVITAHIIPEKLSAIAYGIKNIHYSIHDLAHMEADLQSIQWLNTEYPNIRISLNVPFSDLEMVKEHWDTLYTLAVKIGANIQLIRIFSPEQMSASRWDDRWEKCVAFLETFAAFLEATQREVRYITEDMIKIDLLDIPCLAAGADYTEGVCLFNSDITIDPEMKLSICRWTDSAVPLYQEGNPVPLDVAVREATANSCEKCRFGKIDGVMSSEKLDYYLNAPHYTWPMLDTALKDVYAKTFLSDISYYGKSGNILRLENKFASYLGAKYALSVASGTVSVFLACLALGLSSDDEVLLPVATFPTLAAALLSAGVKIRLCDIDPYTGNISIRSLKEQITSKTKAVLVTHLWGLPVDMPSVRQICGESHIYVIEDCSHAYGARREGQLVGTFGDIACFSLQANKAVYAGEGGMLVTSSREFYERAVVFSSSANRVLDCVKDTEYLKFWGTGLGTKLKMNPMGAPLALKSLSNLEDVLRRRETRARIIDDAVRDCPVFFVVDERTPRYQRVYYTHKLVLADGYVEYRDLMLRMLIQRGLDAAVTSFIPLYQHELSSDSRIVNAGLNFEGAQAYYRRIISIPAFVYEDLELVRYYADTIVCTAKEIMQLKKSE